MHRLRNQLIAVFFVATLAPLVVTVWISVSLLRSSLGFASIRQVDQLSRSLEQTGHEFYQRTRDDLKRDAQAGRIAPVLYDPKARADWPAALRDMWDSGDAERFALAGPGGSRLDYMVRAGDRLRVYSSSLNGIRMDALADEYRRARASVARDLPRGFTYALAVLAAAIWLVTLATLIWWANRISGPIQRLTKGLSEVAAGRLEHRVPAGRDDEVGTAIAAFNHMAGELLQSRERLVYVTRLESWQALARKMAHEIKNSLTPIRLTMEEIAARYAQHDAGFLDQATQIVVEEVTRLERRVRAFTEFGGEPPVHPKRIDVNQLLEERVAFLKSAHPSVSYNLHLADERPQVIADEDLIKGVLTNLLENAAQAGSAVLGVTALGSGRVTIEVHDSGPGLTPQARSTLFEPSVSFKPGGMGLGLSIARRSVVLSGGEIQTVESPLGGAGFRVLLPAA